ncbi:MAG: SirB2 family protein, partial [Cellvibrionaceae bacterium]|nr:SirB2 family protein [Cellvibrionaceae bacterium]
PQLKHAHLLFVSLSFCGFVLRAYWSLSGSAMLQQRGVKILPHINDTLLLLSALALTFSLKLSPHQQPWLASKIVLLLVYIGLGTVALKPRFSRAARAWASLAAIAVFGLMLAAAVTKLPPWQLL